MGLEQLGSEARIRHIEQEARQPEEENVRLSLELAERIREDASEAVAQEKETEVPRHQGNLAKREYDIAMWEDDVV